MASAGMPADIPADMPAGINAKTLLDSSAKTTRRLSAEALAKADPTTPPQ
jgi:hypothetical protein